MTINIDWTSEETHVLFNPRLPHKELEIIRRYELKLNSYKGMIWVMTSGVTQTQKSLKFVGLTKRAFLCSAQGVVKHLSINSHDRILNPLPLFHVGGLGTMARAYISDCQIFHQEEWRLEEFVRQLTEKQITITSLVPTHVYDIVERQISSPSSLRIAVVGGGAISSQLVEAAKQLGWPICPSYGLTEASSQVATAIPNKNELIILPHMQAKVNEEGFICLKSTSLLDLYAYLSETDVNFMDPKQEGWLITEDRGIIEGSIVKIKGRNSDFVKIGGENVILPIVQSKFNDVRMRLGYLQEGVIIAVPNQRIGHEIQLIVEGEKTDQLEKVLKKFHDLVSPYEKIRAIHFVPNLPKSPLGKVLLGQLKQLINCKKER